MATLPSYSQLTWLELAKRRDPNGQAAKIVEVLNRQNPIIQDIPLVEANDNWSHRTTRRTSLPAGTYRSFNEGVSMEASTTEPVTEPIAMLENESQVDVALIDTAPNPKEARNQEVLAAIEGLSQTLASGLIYGNNATNAKQFTGLAPRLAALTTSGDFPNVLGCGGSGADLSSIYIVQWGEDKVHGVFPRGSKTVGVVHEDMGKQRVFDGNAKPYWAYVDHFKCHIGVVVRNPRCIARLANIETAGSSNTLNEDVLIRLLNNMPGGGAGAVLYCNPTIFTQLDIIAKDKTNVQYAPTDPFGRPVTYFRGHPVRIVDAILNTEDAIS